MYKIYKNTNSKNIIYKEKTRNLKKKSQSKEYETNFSKITDLILSCLLWLGRWPTLYCGLCIQWNSLKETIYFLVLQVSIGESFLVRNKSSCLLSHIALGPCLVGSCAAFVATLSICSYCIGPVVSVRYCFLDNIYHLWLLKSLCLLYCTALFLLRAVVLWKQPT